MGHALAQKRNNALADRTPFAAHSRDSIQLQLSSMSSTQLSSSSELVTLRQKLEETERANRDLIGVVDRMKVFELDQQSMSFYFSYAVCL